VRTEGFINSYPVDCPTDPVEVFNVLPEGGPSPFGREPSGKSLDLLKITLKARELRDGERKSAVLTLVVDTSGSMAASAAAESASAAASAADTTSAGVDLSAESRLELVRGALRKLVEALDSQDRVGIVAYSTHPYLVLPHTPARERTRILGAIDSLRPSGATNVEAGLDLAYRVADEVFDPKALNRIILCSDGVANVGARGPEEILNKVEVFAHRGMFLSSVGFGMGKYNDLMMETLAKRGNGNYAYLDSLQEAEKIFQHDLPSTLHVLAKDAKIQVEFNPDVVSHYRLLGYEVRTIRDEDFRNDSVDAGEVGPGSTVTVLYELQRHAQGRGDLGKIYLRYRDAESERVQERNYPLKQGVLATRLEDTTDELRFVAALAESAELLRDSYWSRDGSWAKVIELLGGLSPGFQARAELHELLELALRAQELVVQGAGGKR
jgi:Ca-activated chloride channel family protein